MNNVNLIGRLTTDPQAYSTKDTSISKFSIAIDRIGEGTDFPRVTVFAKLADYCNQYLEKGSLVAVSGHIRTGTYENGEGEKVYTTEVIGERIKFLSWKKDEDEEPKKSKYKKSR